MRRIDVSSVHGDYPVVIGHGILNDPRDAIDRCGIDLPRAVVTDRTVGPLHGRRIAADLGLEAFELAAGETNKTWDAVESTCRRWLADGIDRSMTVMAVGGGIITDTAGFAAASFMRGIRWIAAPTTLLAMVDAAVGGKTGVNLPEGKNLVGAFWPPRLVLADTATLATLPARELSAGLAEVVKAAWIADRGLLTLVPDGRELDHPSLPPEGWEELVGRAVSVKQEIVAADEREGGRRKALNLGHTLGHALEAATAYRRFLHGEAVAWGLEAVAVLARDRGLLSAGAEAELRGAVHRLGDRPPVADLDAEAVCALISSDKKRGAAGVGWVLPTDDGVLIDQRVGIEDAVGALQRLQGGEMGCK
ncbi:MAG: 3-dehydroquinate synthase family protein [Thermoanaerobaculales bacterium]|jgi:3-dehydroquinate synthase|nr:3-dehydroquinate synthase family protein [Thermoanaerobaculales bacterium]